MAKKFAAIEGLHNFLAFDETNNRYLLSEISPEGIGVDHNTVCFVSADSTDVGRCIGSSDAPISINDRYIIVQNDIFALYGDKDISPTPDQTWRPIYVKGEEVLSEAASTNLDFRDTTYLKTRYSRDLTTNSLALYYDIDVQTLANAIVSLIILPSVETPNDGELQVEISDSTVHTDKNTSHDVEIPQNTLSVRSTYIEDQEQPDPEDPENPIIEPVEVEGNFTANTDKDTTVSIHYKGTADRVDWWVDGETRDENDSNNSDAKKFVYIECMQEFFKPISDAPYITLNEYGKTVISEDSIVFITCGKKLTNTSSGTITTSDAEIFDNPEYYDGARFIWTHNKMFSANTWLPIFTRETVRDTLMGLTPPIGTAPHGARLIIQGANGVTVSNSQNESDGYHERIITISGPVEGGGGAAVETGHIYNAGYDSLAEGVNPQYTTNTASGIRSHAEGLGTTASGNNSHAEGFRASAESEASHAEGINTTASNLYSHAEGNTTIASGRQSHAEGHDTNATASSAHAEGFETKAINNGAHAEGYKAEASGYYSHAEGALIHDTSIYSEDVYAKASGDYSHSEGYGNISSGKAAHAEGLGNIAYGYASHAEGIAKEGINPEFEDLGEYNIRCFGDSYIRAFNKLYLENTLKLQGDIVKDNYEFYLNYFEPSYSEGIYIIYADSEAYENGDQPLAYIAPSDRIYLNDSISVYDEDKIEYAFDSGTYFKLNALSSELRSYIDSGSEESFYITYRAFGALNTGTHIEGSDTCASGLYAHAENNFTKATELSSHAEGYESEASGRYSHAEGYNARAKGKAAHAEGYQTEASGDYSHAEGYYTEASGRYSHAEGYNPTSTGTLEKTISTLDHTTKRAFNELFLAKKSSIASIYRSSDFDLFMDLRDNELIYIYVNYVIFAYESENAYLLGADPVIIFRNKDYYYLNRDTTVYYDDKTLYDENDNPIGTEPVYVTIPKGLYLRAYDSNSFIDGLPSAGGTIEKDFYLVLKKHGSFGVASHTEGFCTEASNDYSHAEGYYTEASGEYGAHAEGMRTLALGAGSHAEGHMTEASGSYSHAEGYMTEASGEYGAHAEGMSTRALGAGSHAEGFYTETSGSYSHAEGYQTEASGSYAHAEGYEALALGVSSHAEGTYTYAYGESAHAEGLGGITEQTTVQATVSGEAGEIYILTQDLPSDILEALFNTLNGGIINYSQTGERYIIQGGVLRDSMEGHYTLASIEDDHVYLYRIPKDPESTAKSIQDVFGDSSEPISITINFVYGQNAMGIASHSEGHQTAALGDYSHSEGDHTIADGYASHTEGMETKAEGIGSHAEGISTTASLDGAHAEGSNTTAAGISSHAEGYNTTVVASAAYSHAEGYNTTVSNASSHAEGNTTTASGYASHAEGAHTTASGSSSHAEGNSTAASGNYSHAEGSNTTAAAQLSHAEGMLTNAIGQCAHAEGLQTTASGYASHAEGSNTQAQGNDSHASGKGTVIKSQGGFVCGTYNDSDEDGQSGNLTRFQIGGGYEVQGGTPVRSNILSIWEDDVYPDQYTMMFEHGDITCKSVTQVSDERKKNITGEIDLNKAYELIDKCQTILYTLKDAPKDKEQVGLIAQEVYEIFPELVNIDNKGYMSLDYSRLTVVIFKVLKDVIRRLNDLEKK